MATGKENTPTIIIRRGDEAEESGHGGAWKIAYADFMTAMMTFFLLMWLLSITTEEQRHGIAKFFNPMADQVGAPTAFIAASPKASPVPSSRSKPVKPEVNENPVEPGPEDTRKAPDPALILPKETNDISVGIKANVPSRLPMIIPIGGEKTGGAEKMGRIGHGHGESEGVSEALTEQEQIEKTVTNLKDSIKKNRDLAHLQENITFQVGSDEIRIEMRDTNKKSMFDTGAIIPNKDGISLLREVARWLSSLPENISIMGETDGSPYHNAKRSSALMSNWALSEMRADQARQVLVKAGYPDRKIISVMGRADRDLAVPENPEAAANRRIVLVIHRRNPLPVSFLSNDKSDSSSMSPPSSDVQPH